VKDQTSPVVFVGLMAAGKTTVASRVAARTGWPLRDSDQDIEAETGRRVDQLLEEDGEEALHEREARHLLDLVAARERCLLAAAGSTIGDDRCLAALRHVPVVWLRARVETMVGRFESNANRPRFGQDPAELLRRQLRERGPRFAEVADLVIDIEGRSADDIADEVVDRLGLTRA